MALLLGSVVVLLGARWFLDPGRLTPWVEGILDETLRGDTQIARVEWIPPLSVRVEGFVVTATTGARVLSVERVDATVDPTGLLAGHVHVLSARVDGVRAQLRRPSALRPYDLVEAFQPRAVSTSTAPAAIAITVRDATVTRVEAELDEPGLRVRVRGATVTRARFTLEQGDVDIDADAEATAAEVVRDGIPALAMAARGRGVHVTWSHATAAAELEVGSSQVVLAGEPRVQADLSGWLGPLATEDPIRVRGRALLVAPVVHPTVQAAIATWVPDPSFLAVTGTVSADAILEGELFTPTVTATVEGRGLVVFDRPLDAVHGHLRADPRRVSTEGLTVELGPGKAVARGWVELASRAFQAEVELARVPLAALVPSGRPYVPEEIGGWVRASGDLGRAEGAASGAAGAGSKPAGTAVASTPDDPTDVPRATVDAHLTGGAITLAVRGSLACPRLARVARGPTAPCSLGAPTTGLDLAVDLRHASPTSVLTRFAPGARLATVTLVARARGTVGRPSVAGDVRARGARHPGAPVTADADAHFVLDGTRLTLADAVVTSTAGRAVARGTVELPLFERAGLPTLLGLDVRTTSVALASFTGGRVTGVLDATARVDGNAATPTARVEGDLTSLRVMGALDLEPAHFTARAEGGRYTLAPMVVTLREPPPPASAAPPPSSDTNDDDAPDDDANDAPDAAPSPARRAPPTPARLTLEGSTDLTTLDARVIGQALPLARLVALTSTAPPAVTGTIDVALRASGPVATPVIDAEVEGAQLGLGGVAFSRLTARAAGPLDAIVFDGRLVGLGGTLRLEGTLDVPGRTLGKTELIARNLALPDLTAPGSAEDRPSSGLSALRPDGRIDAELELEGPLVYPEVRGTVGVRDVTLAERPLGLDLTTVTIAPGGAPGLYALTARVGRGLSARALLTLVPAFGITGFAEARSLSLRPAVEAAIATGMIEDEGALTTADAIVSGTADLSYDARGLRAVVELRQLGLSAAELRLDLTAPTTLRYTADGLTLGKLALAGTRGGIEIEGTAADTLDLRATAKVNAAVLTLASRQIQQATGRFTVEATVTGSRDAPEIEASLVIDEPVSIRPRVGVREVVLGRGRVRASRDEIAIEGVDGEIGGGNFRLVGTVGLRDGRPSRFDLALDGTSLPLRTQDLGVEANLSVRLRGSDDAPRLSGRLEIVRARYAKQFRLENFVFVAARADEAGPTLAEQLPWLADLELDLRAQSAGDIELEVDASAVQVSLSLGADVTLSGTPLAPRLGGRIRADSGRLVFPRATLEVTTVDIDLDPFPVAGTSGITVRLVAEGEVPAAERTRTHLITLVLEGPLEQMSLDLQSTGLDRLSVLSLLITGRAALDQEGALAFAGSQLAAPLTGFIEDQLEKALNLGLKLDAEVSTTSVRVTASKELTRRFVVEGSYQRDFDARGTVTTAVSALLYLFDRAFLEARATSSRASVTTSEQTVAGEGASTSVELKYQILGR